MNAISDSEYSEANDPLIGKTLADRYDVLSAIAGGGMGMVYRGRHILMDKIVAIKVLNAAYAQEPGAFARFQHEAKVASQLSHPNIVVVHDFGVTDGKLFYLVMDFVEGRTLGQILDDATSLAVDRVIDVGVQVCDALEYAHEQSLIHRDLKPNNIMLVPAKNGEQVKLLDFGLAKFVGEGNQQKLSQTGYVLGTGFYMSPEQCRGKAADIRSEIYSLGCVLYESLIGMPPLVGDNLLETCQKHIEETPVSMTEARPELNIPQPLVDVVNRALAKDPQERYQSAAELREALKEAKASLAPASESVALSGVTPVNSAAASNELVDAVPAVASASADRTVAASTAAAAAPPPAAAKLAKNKSPVAVYGRKVRKMLPFAVPILGIFAIFIASMIHFNNINAEHRYGARQSTAPVATQIGMGSFQHVPAEAYTKNKRIIEANAAITAKAAETPDKLTGRENKEWTKLYQAAVKDIDKEQYAPAEQLLAKAVTDARHSNRQRELLLALRKLEDVLYVQQKYKEADGLDKEIHSLAVGATDKPASAAAGAKTLEPQDDRIAHLAMVCHKNGQCDTAVSLLEHSVAISERVYGKKSLKTAERISELATLYMALDQPAKAQPLMEQVMEIKATQNLGK